MCSWITNAPPRQLPPSLVENAWVTEYSALSSGISSMQVKNVHLILPFMSEGCLSSHSFLLVCSEALSHPILFLHEICSAIFNDIRKIAECGLRYSVSYCNVVKLCYYSFHYIWRQFQSMLKKYSYKIFILSLYMSMCLHMNVTYVSAYGFLGAGTNKRWRATWCGHGNWSLARATTAINGWAISLTTVPTFFKWKHMLLRETHGANQ